MFSTTLFTLLPLLPFFLSSPVQAHGQTKGIKIGNNYFDAPNIYFDGDSKNANTPIRKGYQASSPSYLLPPDFGNSNKMACEEAAAAPGVADANAGDSVTWFWEGATGELTDAFGAGSWVHAMGPIYTYIGSCNGDCKSVNAADIDWVKIQEDGLDGGDIEDKLRSAMAAKPEPYRTSGVWAMAKLVESGSTYTHTIPNGLKSGQYILRSEMVAVHNPLNGDPTSGPQNYVACAQINIKNGGDVSLPAGTKAGSLYASDGYLAKYSVFDSPTSFNGDGPALWDGASSGSNNNNNQGSSDNSNQGSTDNSNQNQGSTDNSNQNQDQGNTDNNNSNQGQNVDQGSSNNDGQTSTDNSNQGSDNSNQGSDNSNQGSDNSNQGQGQSTDATNTGDNSNQDQGQSQSSGNSTSGSSGKTCRRRTRRNVSIKGRTVARRHVHSKRAAH
ncbi:hypothetical protein V5O48_011595 [Marasmius crinis-equi]|uniref:lytic cellulose monooxygenase (C4-dehydrogenating) n=1 Tax=Marasmius crinis-equi TaxID=585013 RepID=A0ABR3F5J5_9AGAR